MKKHLLPILLGVGVSLSAAVVPLVEKEFSTEPVAGGNDKELLTDATGFKPSGDYSVEFKLKTSKEKKSQIRLFGENGDRKAWALTVADSLITFDDPSCIPANDTVSQRLNSDRTVTVRLGVTSDSIYIFRNGIHAGTRSIRYAPMPLETAGDVVESDNLLRNGDFESEDDITYNVIKEEDGATCLRSIDGWFIYPNFDVWNSRTFLQQEADNTVLRIQRYSWSSGSQWSDGMAMQTVNVVGGKPYDFSFLAYGGEYEGTNYGYAKLEEVGTGKSKVINITNPDAFEKYNMEYTPSADCRQLRVILGVRFPGGLMDWGEVPKVPVYFDNVVLSGETYTYPMSALGYETSAGAVVESVTIDESGAYAPTVASITTDVDVLDIDASETGTAKGEFRVSGKGLAKGSMITIMPSAYVKVSPAKLPYNATNQKVTVTYQGTRPAVTDTLVIKSGDTMHKVALHLKGKDLDEGVLAGKEKPTGNTFSAPLTAKGAYSVEVRAKVKAGAQKGLKLYTAGKDGRGFGLYISDSALMAENPKSRISNPLEVSARKNSDMAHTFRVAVSEDNLLRVYRDGNLAATLEAADFIIPAEFAGELAPGDENLLVNSDFDGAWDVSYVEDGGQKAYVSSIEGWDIYPIEPWNTRQYITKWEVSEQDGYDKANNALRLHRYGWNKGFSDGMVSQAVNVVGGNSYSLSFLAAGGTHKGEKYGYVRIEEVNAPERGVQQTINSEAARTYNMSYTPTAQCSQLRVVIGLKSPGAIGSWGSVPEVPIMVDKLVLTGPKAVGNGTFGFVAEEGTEVEYVAYDMDNALAPAVPAISLTEDKVRIDKTNGSAIVRVTAKNLNPNEDIQVICPEGFEVAPQTLKYDASNSILRVKLTSQREKVTGNIILRSGTTKTVLKVDGRGTPLPEKVLETSPAYTGTDATWTAQGFTPSADGYTVEFKAKAAGNASIGFTGVDAAGAISTYAGGGKHGVVNGTEKVAIGKAEPANDTHTYRYAVTADRHVFVYFDGAPLDTLRINDYANPAGLVTEKGPAVDNLLANPGFEGAATTYVMSDDPDGDVFYNYVQGWTIKAPTDGWNSRTYIGSDVVSDEMGDDNHVLELSRYQWEDGWANSEVSQTVDVVPGSTYRLSAMAMGGFKKSDDSSLGYIRIEEVQTPTKGKEVKIDAEHRYKFGHYTLNYTASAKCTQLRVILGMKKAGKGNESERARFDDVTLSGKSVKFTPALTMNNSGATLEYFTYDASGAYAPPMPHIDFDDDELYFDYTLAEQEIKVSTSDVKDADVITLSTTGNFLVEPEELKANTADNDVTVTFTGTTDGTGSLILKAGNFVKRISLTGYASELEKKDISADPVYTDAKGIYLADASTGFNPGKQGYTIELAGSLERYSGGMFEFSSLNSRDFGANLTICDEFVATSPELGNVDFLTGQMLPNVGDFVYRVAVTPDNLGYVFKNGVAIDTLDLAGIPADVNFARNGESVDCDNLLRNGDFSGNYTYKQYEEAYMLSELSAWSMSGIDDWNARAYVTADSENPGSNIINLQRYDWNPGWAAAVVSQVVNVVPGETYTLSTLVRGGSESGANVAAIEISEVGSTRSYSTNVSNSSGEFSLRTIPYTASATCRQLRVSFILNSTGIEGHGPKCSFYFKDVRLKGKKPLFNPGIRLNSEAPFTLKYFTYDLSGAYLPENYSSVAEVEDAVKGVDWSAADGVLTLRNLPEGAAVRVYSLTGQCLAARTGCADTETFDMASGYRLVEVISDKGVEALKVLIP